MRKGHGSRAKRSGPARGKDNAWFREQVARVLPEEELEMRVRFAERDVERLRKAVLTSLAKDQRLSGQRRRTSAAFVAWEKRMAWHLTAHHGIAITEDRTYGMIWYRHDGTHVGPWKMDALHEQAHGREEQ